MQTKPKIGRNRKPSQLLRSDKRLTGKSVLDKAAPPKPAKSRKNGPNAPRRKPEISGAHCPTADLLPRESPESSGYGRLPVPSATLKIGNREHIEIAGGTSPQSMPVDPVLPRHPASQPSPLNDENLEFINVHSNIAPPVRSPSADCEYSEPPSPFAASRITSVLQNHRRFEIMAGSTHYTVPVATGIVEHSEVQNRPVPMASSVDNLSKGNEIEEIRLPPRKRRTKPRTTVAYPRRSLPEHEAARLRSIWRQRWGAKPEIVTSEDKLRVEFWGNGESKPRCYSCRKGLCHMLSDESGPDGTEEKELLPCGCLYDASLLEMWCVKKGLFMNLDAERKKLDPNVDSVEHLGPKTFGKHKMLLLRFWEMIFGPFNCQTLFNLHGARVNAVWQFSELETQALAQFCPNPGYVQHEKPLRTRTTKRKRDAQPVEASAST